MTGSYEHLIGEWVLLQSAARLHFRGRLLRVDEGATATRLIMHPCLVVYRWGRECGPPDYEVVRDTSEVKPSVHIAEHFSYVGLQPAKWPTDVEAPAERVPR